MNRNSKAALTATELGAAIKSGDISGVWVFCGDEDYLKSHYKKRCATRFWEMKPTPSIALS